MTKKSKPYIPKTISGKTPRYYRVTAEDFAQTGATIQEWYSLERRKLTGTLEKLDRKICNQRQQLREMSEKLEAMKSVNGILRTIGQRIGVCR